MWLGQQQHLLVDEPPVSTGARLRAFTLFNPTIAPEEDAAGYNVLYFYPHHTPLDSQLMLVGLCAAMNAFPNVFGTGDVRCIGTKLSRRIIVRLEGNFWAVAHVELGQPAPSSSLFGGGGSSPTAPNAQSDSFPGGDAARRTAASGGGWKKKTEYAFSAYDDENEFDFDDRATSSDDDDRNVFAGFGDDDDDAGDALERQQLLRDKDRRRKERQRRKLAASRSFSGKRTADEAKYANPAAIAGRDVDIECGITDAVRRIILSHYARFVLENGSLAFTFGRALEAEEAILPPLASAKPKESTSSSSIANASTTSADATKGPSEQKTPQRSKHELRQVRRRAAGRVKILFGGTGDTIVEDCTSAVQSPAGSMGVQDHLAFHGVDSAAFLAAGCAVSRLHNGLPNALQHTVVATGDGRVAATTLDHPATVALLGLASKHKWKPDGTWSFMENATAEDIDTVRALSQAGLGAGGLAYDQVRPSPAPSMPRPPSHHRTHGPSSQRHGPGYTSSKAPPNSTNANRGGDQDGQGGRGSDGPTATVSPSPFRSIIDRLNPFSRREQSMPASAATAPTSAFPGAVLPPAAVAAAANPDIGRAASMPTVASPTRLGGTAGGSHIGNHDSPSRRNPPNATNRPGGGGSVSRSGIDGSSSGVLHHHTQGPATKRSAAAFAGKEPAPPAPEAAAAAAAAAAASNANTNATQSASASAHTPSEAAVGSGLTGTSDESRNRGEGDSEHVARDRSPEPKPVGPIVSGMGGVSASRLARHEVEECATHGKAVLVPLRQPPPKAALPTPVPETPYERIAAASVSDVQPDEHGSAAASSAVVTSAVFPANVVAPPHTTAASLVSLNRGSMRRSVPRTLPAGDGYDASNPNGDRRGGGGGGGDDGPGASTMPQQRASSSSCPAAAPQTIPFYSMQSVETAEKVWFTSTPVARVFVGDMEQALFSFHVGGFVVFCLVPNNYTRMKELQDGVVSSIACALSAESQGLRRVGQAAARGDKASGKLDEAVVYTYANAAISARKTSVQPYTSYSGKAPARDFFENALLLDNMRYGSLVCPPGAANVDVDVIDEEEVENAEGACGGGEVEWSGSGGPESNNTNESSTDPTKPNAVSMPTLEGTTAAPSEKDDGTGDHTNAGGVSVPFPKAVGLSAPLENLRRRREEEAAMFAEQVAALDRIEGADASTSQRPLRGDTGAAERAQQHQQQSSSSGDPNASSLKSPDESERGAFFPESSSNAHRVNGTPMEPRSQLSPPSAASASGQASSRQSPTATGHGTQRTGDGSHHARVTSTAERGGDRGGDVDVFGPYQQCSTTTSRSKLQTHGGHGGYGTKQHGDDETWSPAGSVSSLYAPRDDFGDGGQGASPGGVGGPGGTNDGMSLHEVQRESVAAAAATANRLSLSFAGIQLAAVVAANAGAGAANGAAGRRSLRLHERASMRGGGGAGHQYVTAGGVDSPMKNNRGTGSLSGSGHSSTGGGGGVGGQTARTTQHGFAAGAKFLASAGQASVAASHTTTSARPKHHNPQHGGSAGSIPGHGISTTSITTGAPGGHDRPTLKSQPSMSALSTTSTAAYDPVAPSQQQQRMRKASQDSTSVLSMSQDSSLCITGSLRIQETASFATDPYRSPLRGAGVGGRKSVDGSAGGAMGLAATSVTSTASASAGPPSGQLRRQSSSLTQQQQQQQQIIREQLEATRTASAPTSAGVVPAGGGQQPSTSIESADKSTGPGKPAVDTSVAAEDIAVRDKPQRPVPAFHPSVGSLIRADGQSRGINGSMAKPPAASTGSRSTTPTTTTPTTTTPTTTTPRTSATESKQQRSEAVIETENGEPSNHPKSVLVPRPRHQRQNYFDVDAVSERRENAKSLGPLSSRMEIMNAHFANPAEVEASGTRAVAPLSWIIPKGVTIPKQSSNKPSEISHRITSQGKYVGSSRRTLPSATPVFPFDDSTVPDLRSEGLGGDLECEGCGAYRAGCLALLPDPEASVLAALATTRSPNTDKTTVMHIVRLRQDAWGFVVRGAYREFSFVVTKQVTLKKALHEAARIRGFALVGVNMD